MFALLSQSWDATGEILVNLYNVQVDKWHVFETNTDYCSVFKASAADGGLYCDPWQQRNAEVSLQVVVMNPLTHRKRKLPPLLSMGAAAESAVQVKMAQLTVDRTTKEYKLHVVCYNRRTRGHFAQVYDSYIHGWSVVESRKSRIIGWVHSPTRGNGLYSLRLCAYDCADGNLQRFNLSNIAPARTEVDADCIELVNDHLFVLYKEAPAGSTTNLMQEDGEDDDSNSGKYCISEFHLPEKATAWVKLRVHECDPSIYDCEWETLSLRACNGFLLVCCGQYDRECDPVWLYNLSTCAWRNLPELGLPRDRLLVLCEISWSALP